MTPDETGGVEGAPDETDGTEAKPEDAGGAEATPEGMVDAERGDLAAYRKWFPGTVICPLKSAAEGIDGTAMIRAILQNRKGTRVNIVLFFL